MASGFLAHRLFFSPVFMRKAFIPYSKVTEALGNYTIPTTHIYKYHQFAQKVCHKYSCPSCFKNRMSTIYKQKTVKQITHTHTTTTIKTAVSNSVQHRNSKLCSTLCFQFSSTSVCFVFDGINTHLHPNPFPPKQPLGLPTSAVIPAILSGDIRPIRTFCRS